MTWRATGASARAVVKVRGIRFRVIVQVVVLAVVKVMVTAVAIMCYGGFSSFWIAGLVAVKERGLSSHDQKTQCLLYT